MQDLYVAAGCFWCLDSVYQRTRGVQSSVCGYTGGRTQHPTYEAVCTGTTGHAEAIHVTFDPEVVPAEVLLSMFFTTHDPTSLNRQGYDVGTQYRSALFYRDEQEKLFFQQQIARAQELFSDPVVTTLEPLGTFWEAEPVHQDFQQNQPSNGYCRAIIDPKLARARKDYARWLIEP